jgi:hypothetical protein
MPLTTVDQGLLSTNAQYTGFKNRLINGDMQIDQRNVGTAVTFPSGGANLYTLDRWYGFKQISTGGSFTIQRSSVAPVGFINSALVTITSAVTDTGNGVNALTQFIEGLNVVDLRWGTANAQTVTLSFWVRSSVTGTYSCSLNNDGYDYSYVANYTINAANTWEQKSVTIPGPTAGTWLTTNGAGIRVWFDLGTGTGRNGTANSWVASQIYRTSGSVQLLANNGATFYITGVQLERGQTATSFDVLPFTTELALCQRYYEKSYDVNIFPPSNGVAGYTISPTGTNSVGNAVVFNGPSYKVNKRISNPTITIYGYSGNAGRVSNASTGTDFAANSGTLNSNGESTFSVYNNSGGTLSTNSSGVIYQWTSSAEL